MSARSCLHFASARAAWFFGFALILSALVPLGTVLAARQEVVLHSFKGESDGAFPLGDLMADAKGNLYGTTSQGGGTGCGGVGCGTVFEVTPDGTETVLYSFQGIYDGAYPFAGLIADQAGNLYGTTEAGGAANAGTVFEIAPNGNETVLYSFCSQMNCADGSHPTTDLVMDKDGNLYGTTGVGGGTNCKGGCGIVFELTPDGIETVIHGFKGRSDGERPNALIMDDSGNLYGTTGEGGLNSPSCAYFTRRHHGCGTLFKIASNGALKILYKFCSEANCVDGASPAANLIMDEKGNLYGPTCCGQNDVVFKFAPNGSETVLHVFSRPRDGAYPLGSLVLDKKGDLYGATVRGGANCEDVSGCGTVFKLGENGTESVLYSFEPSPDSNSPHGGVVADGAGNLYGTTDAGGSHYFGTIFEIIK